MRDCIRCWSKNVRLERNVMNLEMESANERPARCVMSDAVERYACLDCGFTWGLSEAGIVPAFFLPPANTPELAETVYGQIRANLHKHNGATKDRRIWRIEYRHNGEDEVVEVGQITHGSDGEPVVAIFENESYFSVCTPSRGVQRPGPIFIGRSEVRSVLDFSEDAPSYAPVDPTPA